MNNECNINFLQNITCSKSIKTETVFTKREMNSEMSLLIQNAYNAKFSNGLLQYCSSDRPVLPINQHFAILCFFLKREVGC